METPIKDVIIGNIRGTLGLESRCQDNRVNKTVKTGVYDTENQKMKNTKNNPKPSEADNEQNDDTTDSQS